MANQDSQTPQDRFAAFPGVIASNAGVKSVGLPEKNTRTILRHAFEAQAAAANLVSADKQAQVPGGLRFCAKQCFVQELQRTRDETDGWKAPNKPAFRETLTSLDNPLRTSANDASVTPFYVARGLQAQVEEAESAKGKRCYPRNERYGTMEQLAPGCLVPATADELQQARAQALLDQAGPACSDAHTCSQTDEEDIQDADTTARKERQPHHKLGASGFPIALDADECQRRKQGARRMEADRRAEQAALEEQLLKEYPHGVPKQLLIQYARQGLSLPQLGYGCASSVSAALAAATLR